MERTEGGEDHSAPAFDPFQQQIGSADSESPPDLTVIQEAGDSSMSSTDDAEDESEVDSNHLLHTVAALLLRTRRSVPSRAPAIQQLGMQNAVVNGRAVIKLLNSVNSSSGFAEMKTFSPTSSTAKFSAGSRSTDRLPGSCQATTNTALGSGIKPGFNTCNGLPSASFSDPSHSSCTSTIIGVTGTSRGYSGRSTSGEGTSLGSTANLSSRSTALAAVFTQMRVEERLTLACPESAPTQDPNSPLLPNHASRSEAQSLTEMRCGDFEGGWSHRLAAACIDNNASSQLDTEHINAGMLARAACTSLSLRVSQEAAAAVHRPGAPATMLDALSRGPAVATADAAARQSTGRAVMTALEAGGTQLAVQLPFSRAMEAVMIQHRLTRHNIMELAMNPLLRVATASRAASVPASSVMQFSPPNEGARFWSMPQASLHEGHGVYRGPAPLEAQSVGILLPIKSRSAGSVPLSAEPDRFLSKSCSAERVSGGEALMLKDYWFEQDRKRMQGAVTASSRSHPQQATFNCSASSSARSMPSSMENARYHPMSNQLLSDGSEGSTSAEAGPACTSRGGEEGLPGGDGVIRPGVVRVTASKEELAAVQSPDSWDLKV